MVTWQVFGVPVGAKLVACPRCSTTNVIPESMSRGVANQTAVNKFVGMLQSNLPANIPFTATPWRMAGPGQPMPVAVGGVAPQHAPQPVPVAMGGMAPPPSSFPPMATTPVAVPPATCYPRASGANEQQAI